MRKKLSPITHHLSPGFTLIELLVVIAIIGILAALIMANFGAARERARDVQRKADLNQIKTALALYYNVWGKYPESNEDYQIVGCGNPPFACVWGEVWQQDDEMVYMKILPSDSLASVDPGREYLYTNSDSNNFTLRALLENKSDKDIEKSQLRCGACSGDEDDMCYVVCQD